MNPVDTMVTAAERDGAVHLPVLTQADLCALGAAHQSLICARTWDWWTGHDDQQRSEITARALEVLTLRKLIVPGTGAVPAVPVPELGLILAARARPGLVVTCQVPGQDAAFEPRFFGVTQQDGGLRTLIRETLTPDAAGPEGRADFGTLLLYTLMTPARAAGAMVSWADRHGTPVQLDVIGHDASGQMFLDRYEIRPDGDRFDVYRPAGGIPSGRPDHMELRQMLTDALTRTAR